jgi:hypothetical protein
MTFEDLRWLDQKRREVARLAEKADQRGHDGPRYLRIIDELMTVRIQAAIDEADKHV